MKLLKPDLLMLAGSVTSVVGHLMSWFKIDSHYLWWFSGYSPNGGWTQWAFVWLAVMLISSLCAQSSAIAAAVALAAAVGTGFVEMIVVAANMVSAGRGVMYSPVEFGLPVLALGIGLAVAGGCRAVVDCALRAKRLSPTEPRSASARRQWVETPRSRSTT